MSTKNPKVKIQHPKLKDSESEILEESLELYKRHGWSEVKEKKTTSHPAHTNENKDK